MDASSAQTLASGLGRTNDIAAGPAVAHRRDPSDERGRINLSWLVQLHWWGILGQAVVVVGAESMTGIALPSTTLVALLVVEVVGNFALGAWASRVRVTDGAIAAVMLLDIIVLTVLLDLTGGAANPFSTLYLVNVALAAVLLPARWSWPLMMASLLAFGSLFVHEELVGARSHHVRMLIDHQSMVFSHLRGMWVACALAAIFVVFFVQRVSSALADRERELDRTRAQAVRREKLASLATLAAGAAHELGTPLSTIAVVVKELERALPTDSSPEVRDDLRLVRDQVTRCREILDRMAAHAGETVGETLAQLPTERWVATALDGLRDRARVRVAGVAAGAAVRGPPRALGDALRGLLKNALQASPASTEVILRVTAEQGRVRASVKDSGPGMPPEILARVGEPFFTTKGPGDGMGLGLFLTRALAEQLGGEFHIISHPGAGTEAWIDLPAEESAERSAS